MPAPIFTLAPFCAQAYDDELYAALAELSRLPYTEQVKNMRAQVVREVMERKQLDAQFAFSPPMPTEIPGHVAAQSEVASAEAGLFSRAVRFVVSLVYDERVHGKRLRVPR